MKRSPIRLGSRTPACDSDSPAGHGAPLDYADARGVRAFGRLTLGRELRRAIVVSIVVLTFALCGYALFSHLCIVTFDVAGVPCLVVIDGQQYDLEATETILLFKRHQLRRAPDVAIKWTAGFLTRAGFYLQDGTPFIDIQPKDDELECKSLALEKKWWGAAITVRWIAGPKQEECTP